METKIYNVEGMRCMHCKANVENALKAMDGVSEAEASLENHNVKVVFDDAKVSPEDMKNAVAVAGPYRMEV